MSVEVLIIFLAVLALANYRFRRSVLYPPFLFCGIWLFDLAILRLNLVDMYPLHAITLNYLAAGAALFSVGGALAFLVPSWLIQIHLLPTPASDSHSIDKRRPRKSVRRMEFLIIVVLLASVVVQIRNLIQVASQGFGEGLFRRAQSVAEENVNNGVEARSFLDYVPLIAVYIAVLFLLERRGRASWIVTTLALVSCIVRGGKGALLIFVSALMSAYLINTNRERFLAALKSARWAILFFAILFAGLLGTEKDTSSVQTSVVAFATNATVQYIVGPLGAFDKVLTHPSDYTGAPHHTFKMFLRVASWFGIISYSPPSFNEWAFVPFGTNVYTLYKPFIADFGTYAALGVMAVIGFMHTLLFRRASTGGLLAVYMFALSVNPIFMAIFDDVYTAFAIYINGLLFGILYMTLRRIRWSQAA